MSTYTRPEVVPLRQGQNFAPIKPLLQLGTGSPKTSLIQDALKERYKHYWGHERLVWREIISAGELVAHMLTGDQLPARNPWQPGGWISITPDRQDGSAMRALNFLQFYFTNCIVKWTQSNPDVVAKAARDEDTAQMAAKAADIVVGHYEQKFFKPWFNIQEALQALTFGTYLERIRHDAGIKGVIGIREVVENRTVQLGEGAGYCGDCGRYGTATEFQGQGESGDADYANAEFDVSALGVPAASSRQSGINICPQCGSDAVLIEPPPSDQIPTVTGQESVEMGDLVCESLLLPGCRWDLRTRAEWSPWFIYQQKIRLGAVRRLLGNKKIPGNGEEIEDIGQQVIKALAYSGQAVGGTANQGWRNQKSGDDPTLCEMWLSPEDYDDVTLKGDEETVGGEPLPKGASLADLFPDGLCAVGLNGFAVTLGLYAERHSDHIASGVWYMKPGSGAGRGQTDLVEVQKRFNKLDSQGLAFMDAAATPGVLHDKNLMSDDEASYLGTPHANIPVTLDNLPEGHKLSDAVHQMMPMNVPGQMVEYTQQFLATAFSTISHVTDFSNGGISGQGNDTARAAMIADANANSVFGPLLSIKGEVRQRVAEIVVEEYRKYFPLKRYFPLGGQYSEQPGLWLSAADLSSDIRFEVTRESEQPQNSLTKQDRLMNFFGVFGGYPMYEEAKMRDPAGVAEMAKLWNVDMQSSGFDVVAQISRKRLDQMKKGLQMLMPMGAQQQQAQMPGMPQMPVVDPMAIISFIQPPPTRSEKDIPAKMNWCQTWFDTDEGQDSPLELRAAVEMLIELYYNLTGFQQAAMAAQAGQAEAAHGEQLPADQKAQGPNGSKGGGNNNKPQAKGVAPTKKGP